jgi:tetratricopeptide (TPR) repeat protein
LRATIEWSYDLCTAEEQRLFGRLGVFNGWSLSAAEAVCDADLETLGSLLDKSLIRREGDRFSMLETIREYADERLEESGEGDELRRRHAEYFIALAEASEDERQGPGQIEVWQRFRTEWDNVRAALGWTLAGGESELGLRLAGGLGMVWLDQNVAVEGERWFRALLENAGSVDEEVRARALMVASMVAGVRSNFEQAASWGEESLTHFRATGSERGIAWGLTTMAVLPLERGEAEAAGPMLEEAEALHRKLGNPGGVRRVLHLQGQQAAAVGDLDRGRRLLREAAELSSAAGDQFSATSSLHSLGDLDLGANDLEAAEEDYREALRVAWDSGADRLVCYSLAGLASTAAKRGDAERAALLWGFAEAYESRLRFTLRWRSLYEERCRPVATANPERYEEGLRLGVDAAVEIALSLN